MNREKKVQSRRILGQDFWQGGQPGYALLSYLSNPDDWGGIVGTISSELAVLAGEGRRLKLLDIGAGIGQTSLQIARRLLATEGVVADWTLIEPDEGARALSAVVLSTTPHGFGSARVLAAVDGLEGESFDAALYVHSTYYLEDLQEQLVTASRLVAGGPIIIVAMSSSSPFFLGGAIDNHRNLAEDVERTLCRMNWSYERRDLASRLSIPSDLWDSKKVVADWSSFVQTDGMSDAELQRLLRVYLTDGVNLRDAVITIHPRG